ncbi:hypothetical protein KIL84_000630 [Mauremys mutica]|uniref:Uncharacterized protein n=1 Tax=Mauremys mutica TaxID=74926 RepID=A0A9D3WZ43_9SAUR|nr:hypothetical protein KIL84_000630 [Mauremys mutica]
MRRPMKRKGAQFNTLLNGRKDPDFGRSSKQVDLFINKGKTKYVVVTIPKVTIRLDEEAIEEIVVTLYVRGVYLVVLRKTEDREVNAKRDVCLENAARKASWASKMTNSIAYHLRTSSMTLLSKNHEQKCFKFQG